MNDIEKSKLQFLNNSKLIATFWSKINKNGGLIDPNSEQAKEHPEIANTN